MITKEKFKELLEYLEFRKEDNIFSKEIGIFSLKVDFKNQEIIYPEDKGLVVNERQTCNFFSNENFVVFECVHRLLEKGYQAEHLELEPKWKLGRGASGGRADILIRDKNKNPFLIIECKTVGSEFDKEIQKMNNNGGQLFSYFRQERSVQYLCLYSSNFKNKKLDYENAIVKTIDRKEDIDAFNAGDDSIKLYKNAKNEKEIFEVWKETFNLYFHYNGIFEYDVNAYEVELKPLKRKNLKPFSASKGTFNIFMEILRHNNISDNANAFNRMLSLLLCKIVDEEKGDDEVLDFQVKEGGDTPEKIQDRLQRLYAKGMKEHLDEEIVYFEDSHIKEIIDLYPRETPLKKLEDTFKQIKYYTHNEFAIKEVHNKELFLQNARVLNEFIKLLQNFQFRYTKKQQILGDFFELLLSHGIKQNEGQFFTPVPIVRFMIMSLGLDTIAQKKLNEKEKQFLPKILDYACGAGHFLTESIDELQKFIETMDSKKIKDKKIVQNIKQYKESTQWAKDYIFGIEKDYRLARTSQIACFLNGDGDANIIFGDGLEYHNRLNLKEKFDVILSNPPYSIKSFKNYLAGNNFQLFDILGENSKEIETLFVERTTQLLKDNARTAIILPSSILSNDSDLHRQTRLIILEHFEIKAIASFGSGTFGATGTNTVILFLQKRSKDFAIDRKWIAEDVFLGKTYKYKGYLDREALFKKFITYRGFTFDDYQSLMRKEPNKTIIHSNIYNDYRIWFDSLAEIKKEKEKTFFKKLSMEQQKSWLDALFFEKILSIEEYKFYLFMLTLKDDRRKKEMLEESYRQQKTIIIRSGEKEQARIFRGYEFSNRKGGEGIQIDRDEKGQAINKMYDDEDSYNPQKVSSYILKSFENIAIDDIKESLKQHIQIGRLSDMLDFERLNKSNIISLHPKINNEIETKWELIRLEDIVETIENGSRPKGGVSNIQEGIISLGGEHINANSGYIQLHNPKYVPLHFYKNSNQGKLKENDILICKDGALTGKIALLRKELENHKAMVNEHVFILRCSSLERQKYIFNFLLSQKGQNLLQKNITGSAQGGLNSTNLKNIKIPLPSLDIQKKIVDECETVDNDMLQAQKDIKVYNNEIEREVQAVINKGYKIKDLSTICEDIFAGGDVPKEKFSKIETNDLNIPIFSNGIENKGLYGYTNKARVEKPSITISARGTIGYTELRKKPFYPIVRLIVVIPKENLVLLEYLNLLIKNIDIKNSGGVIPQLTVPMVKKVKIPLPPLSIQESLIKKIEHLAQNINKAQTVIDDASSSKNKIIKKYL